MICFIQLEIKEKMEFFSIYRYGKVCELCKMDDYKCISHHRMSNVISLISSDEIKEWHNCSVADFEETVKSFQTNATLRRERLLEKIDTPFIYEKIKQLSEYVLTLRENNQQISNIAEDVKLLKDNVPEMITNIFNNFTIQFNNEDFSSYHKNIELVEKNQKIFGFTTVERKRKADEDDEETQRNELLRKKKLKNKKGPIELDDDENDVKSY